MGSVCSCGSVSKTRSPDIGTVQANRNTNQDGKEEEFDGNRTNQKKNQIVPSKQRKDSHGQFLALTAVPTSKQPLSTLNPIASLNSDTKNNHTNNDITLIAPAQKKRLPVHKPLSTSNTSISIISASINVNPTFLTPEGYIDQQLHQDSKQPQSSVNRALDKISTSTLTNKVEEGIENELEQSLDESCDPIIGFDWDWQSVIGEFDVEDEKAFARFTSQQLEFELKLQKLYEVSQKLTLTPLPSSLTYIRPFLSSTFKDFNEERNICQAAAFPRLERLCHSRNVFFAPLDLRWGVTSEESSSGQVIQLCLQEIERSQPFFIASLGFRYGWALPKPKEEEKRKSFKLNDSLNSSKLPAEFIHQYADPSASLLQRTFLHALPSFPFLSDYPSASVTELECLHATLLAPSTDASRAFFYFRSSSILKSLDREKRLLFVESGEGQRRLMRLKVKIVLAGYPVKWFGNASEMSSALESDLTGCIKRDFPLQSLNVLERELQDQKNFAEMKRRIYIAREEEEKTILSFINQSSNRSEMLLLSSAGEGKSSLIANIASQLPASLYIQIRYIGSTSDSSHPVTLLKSLLEELRVKFSSLLSAYTTDAIFNSDTSTQTQSELSDAWVETLEIITASGQPLLVILDGIDAFGDDESTDWLPSALPKSVKLLLSSRSESLSGRILAKRECQLMQLSQLTADHSLSLVRTFLRSYGKRLTVSQEKTLLASPHTSNPLFLTTLLNEVRAWGAYESLETRVAWYAGCNGLTELMIKVIRRLEEDFEPLLPSLVRQTLCLLYVARVGLTEGELRSALQLSLRCTPSTFPHLEFSTLLIRLDQHLLLQRGVRRMNNKLLREAVATEYDIEKVQQKCNELLLLSSMFQSNLSTGSSVLRKCEELPFALYLIAQTISNAEESMEEEPTNISSQGKGTESPISPSRRSTISSPLSSLFSNSLLQLQSVITNINYFPTLLTHHPFDLHNYWTLLEKHAPSDRSTSLVVTSYLRMLRDAHISKLINADKFVSHCEELADFLISTERLSCVVLLLDEAIKIRTTALGQPADSQLVQLTQTKKANLLCRLGKYSDALVLYQKSIQAAIKTEGIDSARVASLSTLLAGLYKEIGEYKQALALYQSSLSSQTTLLPNNHPLLATCMCNLADLYLRLKEPTSALPLYEKSLTIIEIKYGKQHPQAGTVLSALASTYYQLGQYDVSIQLYLRAKEIKEKAYGDNHNSVAIVLNNLASICYQNDEYEQASRYGSSALQIQTKTYGKKNVVLLPALKNLALIASANKEVKLAQSCYEQVLDITDETQGEYSIQAIDTLRSLAQLLKSNAQKEEAIPIYIQIITTISKHQKIKAPHSNPADEEKVDDTNIAPSDSREVNQKKKASRLNGELELFSPSAWTAFDLNECLCVALEEIGHIYQSLGLFDEALPYHIQHYHTLQKRYKLTFEKFSLVWLTLASSVQTSIINLLFAIGVCLAAIDQKEEATLIIGRAWILVRRQHAKATNEAASSSNDKRELRIKELQGWMEDLCEEEELASWQIKEIVSTMIISQTKRIP